MATLDIPSTDPLAFSRVQAFFNRLYPTTGGLALENLGTVTYNSGDFAAWPGLTGQFYGAAGIAYTIPVTPGSGGTFNHTGTLTNNTSSNIDLTNARLDVDLDITNIGTLSGDTQVSVVIAHPSRTETYIMRATSGTISDTGLVTISTTTATGSDLIWESAGTLGIHFNTTDNTIRPFTATVRAVRLSFTQTEFQRRTEGLSAYRRGGDIVPSTMEGGAPTYPTTNGVAMDDVGSVTHSNPNQYSWPTTTGVTTSGVPNIAYSPNTGGGQGGVGNFGMLTNNTGSTIDFTNGRLDIGITVTALSSGSVPPQLYLRNLDSDSPFNAFTIVFFTPAPSISTTGTQFVLTDTSSGGDTTWGNGERIAFSIFNNLSAGQSYTYSLDYFRLRFNNNTTAFAPTGGGGTVDINTGISENGNSVTLSSLRGVDDGVPAPMEQRRDDDLPSSTQNRDTGSQTPPDGLTPSELEEWANDNL